MSRTQKLTDERAVLPVTERVPHEVRTLMRALHAATRCLIDGDATLVEREEMYAVFEEKSFACAYALLCIGVARYASRLTIDSVETVDQILITLCGTRRVAGQMLTAADVMPREKALADLLSQSLHRNRMEYVLEERNGAVTLTLALPRFLAKAYDVCAVNAETILAHVYAVMAKSAGKPAPLLDE